MPTSTVDLGQVKGATGDTGPSGPQGDVGPTGPKGDTGRDGYLPIFELSEDGNLYVTTPDNVMTDVSFSLDEQGNLYYEIKE